MFADDSMKSLNLSNIWHSFKGLLVYLELLRSNKV